MAPGRLRQALRRRSRSLQWLPMRRCSRRRRQLLLAGRVKVEARRRSQLVRLRLQAAQQQRELSLRAARRRRQLLGAHALESGFGVARLRS